MAANDFKVFKITNLDNYIPSFGRKDLYRICLLNGKSRFHYNDQSIGISGDYLFFGNINTPYSWEIESEIQIGYSCLFTEGFLNGTEYLNNQRDFSPFRSANIPLYILKDKKQTANIEFIFERIIEITNSDYHNRREMTKVLIALLMQEAITIRPQFIEGENISQLKTSSKRLFILFQNLLDAQFPIENKHSSIILNSVSDFADKIGVHPNYLNRAIKKETGKTTLRFINERIITEAKVLLEYTDWSISEISFCLGFEYHSYFDNVFKKITGVNPKSYRENS